MLKLGAFILFAISFCLHDVAADCTPQAINDCVEKVQTQPQTTKEGLDELCGHVDPALECVKKLECPEDDPNYLHWQGAIGTVEGAEYICTKDARKVYLENADKCSAVMETVAQSRECIERVSAIKDESADARFCKRNSTLLRCQYDVVKDSESCNEEFARVYATFSYYVGKRGLPSNCKLDTSYLKLPNGAVSLMTSSMTSLSSLIIISMMLSRR